MELLFDDTRNIRVCTQKECGDKPEGREDVKVLTDNFFESAWIGTDIYINKEKFDISKRFIDKKNKTLSEYLSEHDKKYTFHYGRED